jgi:hypothetical protein
MNREVHVRICEGLGVRFPRATRLKDLGLIISVEIVKSIKKQKSKSRIAHPFKQN